MGDRWLVTYNGGQYWAAPNYVNDRIYDWTLLSFEQGGTLPAPLRVAQSALVFVATAIPRKPLFRQPQAYQIGV